MKPSIAPFVGALAVIAVTIVLLGAWLQAANSHYRTITHERHIHSLLQGAAVVPFHGDGDPEVGKALFAANCAACHQSDGRGRIGLAPSIRNSDFLALASDFFIKRTINGGRPGTAMAPRPDLSDEDLTHIIAFLRSEPSRQYVVASADAERHRRGDADSGRQLYETFCAACHGPNGEGYSAGGSGPAIGTYGFLNVASDDFIYQTVKYGRRGTPMMSFMGPRGVANLSESEVADIIAFLRMNVSAPDYLRAPPRRVGTAGRTDIADAGRGQTLFVSNCAVCHQSEGQGRPGLAPSIRNRDFLAIASDEFIKTTVIQGRPGTAMLGRADLGGELHHIIAYLRDLPVAHPLDVVVDTNRKRVGNVDLGRATYAHYCAPCHGPKGEGYGAGGSGPGIGLSGFLSVASDDYIFQTIKHGRVGTPMKSFVGARGLANLEETDVNNIISYLRSLDPSLLTSSQEAQ